MHLLVVSLLITTYNQPAPPRDFGGAETPDFAALFREYYPRVYNYLRYRVPSPQDTEDLVSAVFERAYANRAKFNPARGEFAAWLFRIAHNTLVNYYRSHQRRSIWEGAEELPEDLVQPESSPEGQFIQKEALVRLWHGLAQLNERDQEIITLKFAGQLGNKEIGEVMALKEKTVSVVLLRAVRRLQEIVGQEATK